MADRRESKSKCEPSPARKQCAQDHRHWLQMSGPLRATMPDETACRRRTHSSGLPGEFALVLWFLRGSAGRVQNRLARGLKLKSRGRRLRPEYLPQRSQRNTEKTERLMKYHCRRPRRSTRSQDRMAVRWGGPGYRALESRYGVRLDSVVPGIRARASHLVQTRARFARVLPVTIRNSSVLRYSSVISSIKKAVPIDHLTRAARVGTRLVGLLARRYRFCNLS